jgi:hypothetical protein
MDCCKFRKLSSVIIISIFTLIGAQILDAAPYKSAPNASLAGQSKSCRSVSGLSPLLKRGNVLLFGEIHGTQEIAAFIADAVCMAVKKRIPVTLGLEIPVDEQEAIDRFLDSGGETTAKARLTEEAFWKIKDGRSSIAMLQLIDQVRILRAAGAKLRIVAYDQSGSFTAERDKVMAQNLATIAARKPRSLLIVLSGDNHTRLTRGNPWNKEFESMGYLLTKSFKSSSLISFKRSHEGGEAWICIEESPNSTVSTCKPVRLKPETGALPAWSVKLTSEPNAAYSGTFGVGRITASPPVHQ